MICPKCKGNRAFLWTEDGIPDADKNTEVEVRCPDCGSNNYEEAIGTIGIDITVKRNTFKIYTD